MNVSSDSEENPVGQVYLWHPDPSGNVLSSESFRGLRSIDLPGVIEKRSVPLCRLDTPTRLRGRFVEVFNETATQLPGACCKEPVPLGNAVPDGEGNFVFEPHHGGGRMEKYPFSEPEKWERYVSASRFSEVNAYYHTDRVAHTVDRWLKRMGVPSLPRVVVRVNAHNAIACYQGCRDGVLKPTSNRWYPFQGGHYRLPTHRRLTVAEYRPLAPDGEIHLGPGWRLTEQGALAQFVGGRYRCNAGHNAGIIYHEYGHHLTRHTADFRCNRFKAPHRQCNVKTAADEAYSDYLAATLMHSPHIWAFHHAHHSSQVHPRSLIASKTMDDYDPRPEADPHANGTILAATLWDIRCGIIAEANARGKSIDAAMERANSMVVHSLILLGTLVDHPTNPKVKPTRRLRNDFRSVLAALLESDRRLHGGEYQPLILDCFRKRKIITSEHALASSQWESIFKRGSVPLCDEKELDAIARKDPGAVVPRSDQLLSAWQLDQLLERRGGSPWSVVAVGDVMVGSRARHRTEKYGPDYIFHAVAPLFRRGAIVLGNQEGPIARDARKRPRNHSYKVDPKYTRVLRRAGFHVMTLANNHLLDCGREGVLETFDSLRKHRIHVIGAGTDRRSAHQPVILRAGAYRIGLLGYYWNRRTSARSTKPGSAIDSPDRLAEDISALRSQVDRIVVTVHWGVPYQREPGEEDREKARLMIELGADIVIGHHPHIVQGIEVVHNRPIIYSVGNFAFGTGNSKAESLVVAARFEETETVVDLFPAYVKNRDSRVNYQPKIMTGEAANEVLERLSSQSPGVSFEVSQGVGRLVVPWRARVQCGDEKKDG